MRSPHHLPRPSAAGVWGTNKWEEVRQTAGVGCFSEVWDGTTRQAGHLCLCSRLWGLRTAASLEKLPKLHMLPHLELMLLLFTGLAPVSGPGRRARLHCNQIRFTIRFPLQGWRLSLGLAGVPACVLLLGGILLPESPNSLIER